ncbi:hypothetical protein LCGC14_2429900 [marine sediment metagenome]|uniref:Uncharacterized protein n=1 Tax=marine sediment metagenome TaxID=412755 RepID=A0A0F9C9J0_9ZZZZ
MVSSFGVRIVDNGFIVHWVSVDSHMEQTHEEKVFLTRSDMEAFVIELMRLMRSA